MDKTKLNAFIDLYMSYRAVCGSDLARDYFEKNICPDDITDKEIAFFYDTGRIVSVNKEGSSLFGVIDAEVDVYKGVHRYGSERMDLTYTVWTDPQGALVDCAVELDW